MYQDVYLKIKVKYYKELQLYQLIYLKKKKLSLRNKKDNWANNNQTVPLNNPTSIQAG